LLQSLGFELRKCLDASAADRGSGLCDRLDSATDGGDRGRDTAVARRRVIGFRYTRGGGECCRASSGLAKNARDGANGANVGPDGSDCFFDDGFRIYRSTVSFGLTSPVGLLKTTGLGTGDSRGLRRFGGWLLFFFMVYVFENGDDAGLGRSYDKLKHPTAPYLSLV